MLHSSGAGLLPVIIGEYRAFVGDAIDVWRAVTHHAAIVSADISVADVIGHDDKNVGLLRLLRHGWRASDCRGCSQSEQPPARCPSLSSSYAPLAS